MYRLLNRLGLFLPESPVVEMDRGLGPEFLSGGSKVKGDKVIFAKSFPGIRGGSVKFNLTVDKFSVDNYTITRGAEEIPS